MMTEVERLAAIDDIRQIKAAYFRGVDTGDSELVRSILADDCVLDYVGCCTDPATGHDFMPSMNIVLRGSASWSSNGFKQLGIVSVHQGHNSEIAFPSESSATGIWSMTDRLFMPAGSPFAKMTGYGHYHERYVRLGARWKIQALRLTRIRVEAR